MGLLDNISKEDLFGVASAGQTIIQGTIGLLAGLNTNQEADRVPMPVLKSAAYTPVHIDPNTRPFEEQRSSVEGMAVDARDSLLRTGKMDLYEGIFSKALSAMSDITAKESQYISNVQTQDEQLNAEALNRSVLSATEAFNKASMIREQEQQHANDLVYQSNAVNKQTVVDSMSNIGNIWSQSIQNEIDLRQYDELKRKNDLKESSIYNTKSNLATFSPVPVPSIQTDNIGSIFDFWKNSFGG